MSKNKQKNRINVFEQHKRTRKELPLEYKKTMKLSQKGISIYKNICEKTNKVSDIDENTNKAFKTYLTPDRIQEMPDNLWSEYERLANKDNRRLENFKQINYDIENQNRELGSLDSTAVAYCSTAVSTTNSILDVIKFTSDIEKDSSVTLILSSQLEETLWDDIDFIKRELLNIMPNVSKNFEDVVSDWSSKEDEYKYKILLDLRSLIFHQLLDNVCKEPDIGKLPWSKNAQKGTNEPRLRFRQVKYFMLGNRDEASIPPSTLDSINNTANELQLYFDNMSGFGKEGKEFPFVEGCYRETISSFANALRIKPKINK